MPNNQKNIEMRPMVFVDFDTFQTLLQFEKLYVQKSEMTSCECKKEKEKEGSNSKTLDQIGKGFSFAMDSDSDSESEETLQKDDNNLSDINDPNCKSNEIGMVTSNDKFSNENHVLLTHLPKKYRCQAKGLLVSLLSNMYFNYDIETLEISLFNKSIPGSNIAKLLLSCFKPKVSKTPLKGKRKFFEFLRNQNLDKDIHTSIFQNNDMEIEQKKDSNKEIQNPNEEMAKEAFQFAKNVRNGSLPFYYTG